MQITVSEQTPYSPVALNTPKIKEYNRVCTFGNPFQAMFLVMAEISECVYKVNREFYIYFYMFVVNVLCCLFSLLTCFISKYHLAENGSMK